MSLFGKFRKGASEEQPAGVDVEAETVAVGPPPVENSESVPAGSSEPVQDGGNAGWLSGTLGVVGKVRERATDVVDKATSAIPGGVTSAVGSTVTSGVELASAGLETSMELSGAAFGATVDAVSRSYRLGVESAGQISTAATQLAPAYQSLASSAQQTPEVAGQAFVLVLDSLTAVTLFAGGTVDMGLDYLADDPDKDQGLVEQGLRLGAGLLPIVGNLGGVADARLAHRKGRLLEVEGDRGTALHNARRDCLLAVTALGLEVCTIGLSGKAEMIVKAGEMTLGALSLGRLVEQKSRENEFLPDLKLDFLTEKADAALGYQPLRDAMEYLLTREPQEKSDTGE